MTLNQAIGIKSCNTLVTGEEITHQEKYRRIIEFLGGPYAVIPYIPFTKEQITKAIKKDPYLNNLSMKKWDRAAGFVCDNTDVRITGDGLWKLCKKHGITAMSVADGVCILKEAAREWVKETDTLTEKYGREV